ncbi:hypothetical protein LNP00_02005 [Fructobacillus sp. M158]|uniref:hypothetical protein n=1 Tax=Fructobacillus parabroussonetiae TaxID=2713174 RepID=UPI00200AD3BB|nr:hypothetical protein [Fructobacillus parabroussonetiae]MCK8617143.1 hypothetical protein [Fructobacillus parabroussonetiae]
MSNTPIRLVPLKDGKQNQTIYYNPSTRNYYKVSLGKKSGHDFALFITFLISAIIGTVLWLGKLFFPIPKITLTNPFYWWLGLFLTTILPAYFWWRAYHNKKQHPIEAAAFKPFQPSALQKKYLKGKWGFERVWILFVLLLLPPTSLLFLILYIVKMNLVDAVLLTLHGTLFLRRLQPDVWQRLKLKARQLM